MKKLLIMGLLSSTIILGGCETELGQTIEQTIEQSNLSDITQLTPPAVTEDVADDAHSTEDVADDAHSAEAMGLPSAEDLPLGEDYIEINNNIPYFTNEELEVDEAFMDFSTLDYLGRVGEVNALLDEELMPPEQFERGGLGHITPSGWNQNQRGDAVSDIVPGGWLYNRSHLIGHQLGGEETDVAENLITGTRQFNMNMLPFENFVANVVENGTQVRYRVTPVYDGDNLLSHGVVMEGFSLDEVGELGDELTFNIFVPNEQDGIMLDYSDGSWSVDE